MHLACGNSKTFSTDETVRVLLDHQNIDVNFRDGNGMTALHIACKKGLTSLRWCCNNNDNECFEILLSHPDIHVNLQAPYVGMTALHWACEVNNIKAVKMLLKYKNNLLIN